MVDPRTIVEESLAVMQGTAPLASAGRVPKFLVATVLSLTVEEYVLSIVLLHIFVVRKRTWIRSCLLTR